MHPPPDITDPEAWIDEKLSRLERSHLYRRLTAYPQTGGVLTDGDGRRLLNLSSNDYLDLARHPRVVAGARRALDRTGAGAASSRLVVGTLPIHEELEQALAALKGYPAALLFGSGYLANIGILPALAGPGDVILADRLVHASLIDGILLSRARFRRFRHNDPDHLRTLLARETGSGRRVVVTESVFSMDGDPAPLAELADCCDRAGAMLVVDEAHAMGVFGPAGAGRVRELGLQHQVQLCMGTLSKALGAYGGFVACSERMRQWLINRARTVIYSTALPPAAAGAALAALEVIHENPDLGPRLLAAAERFRRRLRERGLNTLQSASQIVPVVIGGNAEALRSARDLRRQGILAVPMRPPTVPAGSARLRLSLTAAHTDNDLEQAARALSGAVPRGSP